MSVSPTDIDALLPQTQCELCEHPGCKPYAESIAAGEDTIDRCVPGGLSVLKKLGELTGIDPSPYIDNVQSRENPDVVAVVREDECIGCTKCIQACPVDAIIGTAKHMHVVITKDCNGCELCVPPCPVDCIDIKAITPLNDDKRATQYTHNRKRFNAKNQRLAQLAQTKKNVHSALKKDDKADRLAAIRAALARKS